MLASVSSFSYLIPVGIGLLLYSRLPEILRLILLVVIINGMVDNVSFLLHKISINNSLLLNLYVVFPYVLIFTYPFYKSLKSSFAKTMIFISFIVTVLVNLYLVTQLNIFEKFNGLAFAFAGVHLIFVNLIYLFYTAVKSEEIGFKQHPLFFISAGILIYQAFVCVLTAFINELEPNTISYLWKFRSIFYILLNILISFVFWRYARIRK